MWHEMNVGFFQLCIKPSGLLVNTVTQTYHLTKTLNFFIFTIILFCLCLCFFFLDEDGELYGKDREFLMFFTVVSLLTSHINTEYQNTVS